MSKHDRVGRLPRRRIHRPRALRADPRRKRLAPPLPQSRLRMHLQAPPRGHRRHPVLRWQARLPPRQAYPRALRLGLPRRVRDMRSALSKPCASFLVKGQCTQLFQAHLTESPNVRDRFTERNPANLGPPSDKTRKKTRPRFPFARRCRRGILDRSGNEMEEP